MRPALSRRLTAALSLTLLSTGIALQPAIAAPIKFGLLGDSIVDDYLGPSLLMGGNTNLAAGSFGQILAVTRPGDFDFGDYRAPPLTWDQIRFSGYEFNWATAGAAASSNATIKLDFGGGPFAFPVSVNLAMQVAGMVPLIEAGRIDTVYISTGGNDFFYRTNVINVFTNELTPAPDGDIDADFINDLASELIAAVDALRAAGPVNIILAEVPIIPIMDQAQVDGVVAVNQLLQAAAASRGIVFFDSQEWSRTGANVDPVTGDITIGHVTVPYASRATEADLSPDGQGLFCNFQGLCPLESHAGYYLAEDGIHLNTLLQGQLANEIIKLLNAEFGHNIALLTDGELLELVGITVVPVPAAGWLLTSALLALGWARRRVP